jgi:drug/metabolite transporter (DMT)-like permease
MSSSAERSVPSSLLQTHLALALVAVLFSLNYIIGKIGLRSFEPFAFAWLRVFGSALLLRLALLSLRRERQPMTRSDWRSAAFYALLGVCINQLMCLKGLSLTSAHEAAILITTIPVFTLVGAIIVRTESATALKITGIALAGAGALLVIGIHPSGGGSARLFGDLFILINCAAYGTFLVVSRPMSLTRPALEMVSHFFTIGCLLMLPFCASSLLSTKWSSIPLQAWLALAGVIVGPTVGAYVLSAWALARAESSMVAAYTYVQPFLATLLAALFLGERLTMRTLLAAVLIIAGVALSTWRRPEVVAAAETSRL